MWQREHSSHGQRHKYEERCGFGRSFWCVTYLAFCIDLLYKTAIFGPFFDITPYHRSTIFLSLEQRNQIYIMDWKQMHTLLIKRYGSVMRARSSLFTRKCIWLKSNIMEMIPIEKYTYFYMYKINRKIIIFNWNATCSRMSARAMNEQACARWRSCSHRHLIWNVILYCETNMVICMRTPFIFISI